jgi:hypothetical protein
MGRVKSNGKMRSVFRPFVFAKPKTIEQEGAQQGKQEGTTEEDGAVASERRAYSMNGFVLDASLCPTMNQAYHRHLDSTLSFSLHAPAQATTTCGWGASSWRSVAIHMHHIHLVSVERFEIDIMAPPSNIHRPTSGVGSQEPEAHHPEAPRPRLLQARCRPHSKKN